MLGAEGSFAYRQRPLAKRPRSGEGAPGLEQVREFVEARRVAGMLGAERRFADRQRPLVQRTGPCKIALVAEQVSEIIEAFRGVGMLGAERPFTYRQGVAEKLRSRDVRCTPVEISPCPIQELGPS